MFQKRIWIFLGFVTAILFIIAARIFSSQVINNDYYITQARRYATRMEVISDPRGRILDRSGSVLVDNRLSFDLLVAPVRTVPEEKKIAGAPKISLSAEEIVAKLNNSLAQSESVANLTRLLNTSPGTVVSKISAILQKINAQIPEQSNKNKKPFVKRQIREKYKIMTALTADQALAIDAHPDIFAGFSVDETTTRRYLFDELACHVIGYIGPVWKEEYDALVDKDFFRDTLSPDVDDETYQALLDIGVFKNRSIGRTGIERLCERKLIGKSAVRLSEYDEDRQMQELSRTGSIPPEDVSLTIDLALQKKMEQALRDKTGAAIVMNIHTGEILGMASSPAYNLNDLQPPLNHATLSFLSRSPLKPAYNRAISGEYPPGSIFKIVTGIAALESGKITPYTEFDCKGYYYPSIKKFACWISAFNRVHGPVSIEEGFMHSCNVFFFNAGRLAGPDNIANWAEKFGFGSLTGIDISGERKGRVPRPPQGDVNVPDGANTRRWALADTLNTSIGQGDLLVTPLQIVRMIAAISNGGKLVTPHVIRDTKSPGASAQSRSINSGGAISNFQFPMVTLSPATVRSVHRGMNKVVHADGGTANGSDIKNFPIAGKTGTAEVFGRTSHAWFAGFAPYDKPQIAVVVIMEYGGRGSEVSAPIAAQFMAEALAAAQPPQKAKKDETTEDTDKHR